MNNGWSAFLTGIVFGWLVLAVFVTNFSDRTMMYKEGQVDAMSGKIVYVLKEHSDGTRTWEHK